MKSLLDFDNPFIQLLCRIGDMMIVNFLFCVCSLPVVTAGASLAGLIKVVMNLSRGGEPGIVKTFFRGFRENFRQATALWLILLVIAASLVCDLLIGGAYLAGAALTVLRGVVLIIALAVLAVACYMFPLLVRFENTLVQHFRNALILTMWKLPRTVGLVALNAFPLLLAWFEPVTFLKTLAAWLIVGCAGLCYLCCSLLRPVLTQLEAQSGQPSEAEAEAED